jgi:hypothetical protein
LCLFNCFQITLLDMGSVQITVLAVRSVSSQLCQASGSFRIGSNLRCMLSTPTEMQSINCLATCSRPLDSILVLCGQVWTVGFCKVSGHVGPPFLIWTSAQ